MLKYRERSLIERGYDENFIVSISEFSEDEVNNVAMKVFKEISKCKNVNKFVVEEPTLNEIFISKVGEKYE